MGYRLGLGSLKIRNRRRSLYPNTEVFIIHERGFNPWLPIYRLLKGQDKTRRGDFETSKLNPL